MSIAVAAPDGPYAVAVAELPLSAHRSLERAGSIVVIDADAGWGKRARAAVGDRALAVVVRDARSLSANEFDAARAAAARVVIERGLLRADTVADAVANAIATPSLVQIECSGSSGELATVTRDAIGWGRVLAGGRLEFVAATMTSRGLCVLLERREPGAAALPVTVLASRRAAPAWIRATAIGSDRLEVTIDSARRLAVVERSTAAGRTTLPTRWESPERVVLRRAIAFASTGEASSDLAELEHDAVLAAISLDS